MSGIVAIEPDMDRHGFLLESRDRDRSLESHRSPGSADVALIVEVSDSSLSDDRKLARIYGGSGIPAYWIVNLVDRQDEVYTLPYPDGYHARQDFAPGQFLPVVIDGAEVGRFAVADILL